MKIIWTEEEVDLLSKAVLKKHPDGKYPFKLQNIVSKIQKEILSKDRWRNCAIGANTVPKIAARIGELLDQPVAKAKTQKKTTRAKTSALTPEAPVLPILVGNAPIEDVLAGWLAGIFKASIKKVLTDPDFSHIIRNLYPRPTPEGITSAIVAASKHNPTPISQERVEKTKVLLCGIMPNQADQFTQTFPDLHIKFWYSDRPGQGTEALRAKGKWADKIFMKLDQCSHTVPHTLKGIGKEALPVNGSVSAMMNALAEVR